MPCTEKAAYRTAVIGGGCAGLTLARHLTAAGVSPLAVIDPGASRPDHIWGYWDDGGANLSLPRPLSSASWQRWAVITERQKVVLNGDRFCYRALSSQHYEESLRSDISGSSGTFVNATAKSCTPTKDGFRLTLDNDFELSAEVVFDSRPPKPPVGALLQHFGGWHVRMERPVFDPKTAILMDFRVSQDEGIHFIYLLPFHAEHALVESTVFSPTPKSSEWYDSQIKAYLSDNYSGVQATIEGREAGVIPLAPLVSPNSFGTAIGLRAETHRASSGYAFSQIQIQAADLALDLIADRPACPRPGYDSFEAWMDNVFLSVLRRSPDRAPEIFLRAARALTGDQFATFMRGQSGWPTRLRLMSGLPLVLFLSAALDRGSR